MKTFLALISCCSILFSCNNTANNTVKENTAADTSSDPAEVHSCYQFIAKQDTFDISYTRNGDAIKGIMRFNHYEKDKSEGSIQGRFSADTLKLFYNFRSEGAHSVRQIYLKQEGGQLITGTGDEYTKADSALLKDPSKIRFNGMVYKKIDCVKE